MIATPNTLRDQILGRINQMLGKSKDEKIKFENENEMIVTTHEIYADMYETTPSVMKCDLHITAVGRDARGNSYAVMEDNQRTARSKRNLNVLSVEELYKVYQELSQIISPSTAVYAEIADEA